MQLHSESKFHPGQRALLKLSQPCPTCWGEGLVTPLDRLWAESYSFKTPTTKSGRAWHVIESQQLHHFNAFYPQKRTQGVCHLASEIQSELMSAMGSDISESQKECLRKEKAQRPFEFRDGIGRGEKSFQFFWSLQNYNKMILKSVKLPDVAVYVCVQPI